MSDHWIKCHWKLLWYACKSTKNSKNTCLGGCSVLNALNLEELGVKIHNYALLLDYVVLLWWYCIMFLFSRRSPERTGLHIFLSANDIFKKHESTNFCKFYQNFLNSPKCATGKEYCIGVNPYWGLPRDGRNTLFH